MLNPLSHRKVLKKGLPGWATIVEMGALDRGGSIEQVLGRKLTPGTSGSVAENDPAMQMQIIRVVQQHMAEKAAGGGASRAPAGGGGDDPVAKLEPLAALKDSGALTEKELGREKKKLLGS